MTGPQRVFLGSRDLWLWSCADWLIRRFDRRGTVDLSRTVVVVPGKRAGRLLLAALLRRFKGERWRFVPPRLVTLGGLEGVFDTEVSSDNVSLSSLLRWWQVVGSAEAADLETLFGAVTADVDDAGRLDWAFECQAAEAELAGHGLTVADAGARLSRLAGFPDLARWGSLARLAARVESDLASLNLEGINQRRSRWQRESRHSRFADSVKEKWSAVVLCGLAELPGYFRELLRRSGLPVAILLAAEEDEGGTFDEFGMPLEAWAEAELDWTSCELVGSLSPGDEARGVAATVGEWLQGGRVNSGGAADIAPCRPGIEASARQVPSVEGPTGDESLAPELEGPISIAVASPATALAVQELLAGAGIASHSPYGRPFAKSHWVATLRGLIGYWRTRSTEDLARLIRLPAIEALLLEHTAEDLSSGPGSGPIVNEVPVVDEGPALPDVCSLVDRYLSETMLERLIEPLPGPTNAAQRLRGVDRLLMSLSQLGDQSAAIAGPASFSSISDRKPLADWCRLFMKVLSTLVAGREGAVMRAAKEGAPAPTAMATSSGARFFHRAEVSVGEQWQHEWESAVWLGELLERGAATSGHVATGDRLLSAGLALDLLLRGREAESGARDLVPYDSGGTARRSVEVVGWLELALDDGEQVVVANLNEGLLPQRVRENPFLGEGTRRALALPGDRGRLARDTYLLRAAMLSRQRTALSWSRVTAQGDPLAPSRLLLGRSGVDLASDVLRLFGPPAPSDENLGEFGGEIGPRDTDVFPGLPAPWLPAPSPPAGRSSGSDLAEVYSVTSFRSYLACPYRYYLNHVLGLRVLDDDAVELDGAAFGRLIHDVLRGFAAAESAQSSDIERVRKDLDRLLDDMAEARFGTVPGATIRVQIEQARRRLAHFSEWHCAEVAAGWVLAPQWAERRLEAKLTVDGKEATIVGRLDRVDVHRDGRVRIVDYKTADAPRGPRAVHQSGPRNQKRWIDLQLPLYRLLASSNGLGTASGLTGLELGYVLLSKHTARRSYQPAEWDVTEEEEAIETARDVVRRVRCAEFWPPGEAPRHDDGYGWLVGDPLGSGRLLLTSGSRAGGDVR